MMYPLATVILILWKKCIDDVCDDLYVPYGLVHGNSVFPISDNLFGWKSTGHIQRVHYFYEIHCCVFL